MKRVFAAGLALALTLIGLSPSAQAAAPGITSDEVRIGQTGVFSGPMAEPALQAREGARLYFGLVNARGGVAGRQIKLVSYDDKFDAKIGAANTRKLLTEDKVFALFHMVGAGSVAASMPLINEHQVPVIGVMSGAEALRGPKMNLIYHTRASYTEEVAKMVQHLKTTGVQPIAVVYQDDPFGRLGLKSAQAAFERHGVKPVAEVPIDVTQLGQIGQTTVAQLLKSEPRAIIMITAGKPSSAFIAAYLKSGARPQFFGVSVLSSKDLRADLGPDVRGIVVAQVAPSPTRLSVAIANEYRTAAQEANVKDISFSGMEGFITAKVFVEALRRAGNDPTRASLMAALASLNRYNLGGFFINFAGNHREGSTFVDLSIVNQAGQFIQ